MNFHFSFREIQEINELDSALRLRFQHFNRINYRHFLNQTDIPLDLDPSDFHARHWGLFQDDHKLIGCARIIDNTWNDTAAPVLLELAEKYQLPLAIPQAKSLQAIEAASSVKADEAWPPVVEFPVISYQSQQGRAEISRLLQKNSSYKQIELGRFVMEKGHSFRLAKFMIDSGLGIYKNCYQTGLVLLACRTTHERFWRHYSFKKIGQPYEVNQLPSINLYNELQTIPSLLNERFEKQAKEYLLHQQTTLTL